MKQSSQYKNWRGPFKLENLTANDSAVIWFPELCSGNEKKPDYCIHPPVPFKKFKSLKNKPLDGIYVDEQNRKVFIRNLEFLTAIILFLGAAIGLINIFLSKKGEVEIVKKKQPVEKQTTTVNKINVLICENCKFYWEYEDRIGKANGKVARFRPEYLTNEKRWKYKSDTSLEDNSSLSEVLISDVPNFKNYNESLGLIAVGVSSQECLSEKRELLRAGSRADKIIYALRKVIKKNNKELYKLNLGRHKNEVGLSTSETGEQRRIIIVAIMEKDPTMTTDELGDALKDAFNDGKRLKFKTNGVYSDYDFVKEN